MNKKIVALQLLFVLALAGPSWAESKSKAIQVSCSIPVSLQVNRGANGSLMSRSNLEKRSVLNESWKTTPQGRVRLVTLTSL